MYKILLDTNILLDYLIKEREGYQAALKIMKLAAEEKIRAYVSPISILDLFFILRKQATEQERKEIIESLLEILDVAELDMDILQLGLYAPIADYEDGIQYISAGKINADFIVTGNRQFLSYDLDLRRVSANKFMEILDSDSNKIYI